MNIEELKAQRKEAQEQQVAALTEGWEKIAAESLKETNKIKLPVGVPKEGEDQQFFEWDLRDAPKEEVDQMKRDVIALGRDPNSEDAKNIFQKSLRLSLIDKNLPQIMQKHVSEKPKPLKDFGVPKAVAQIVENMMEKDLLDLLC